MICATSHSTEEAMRLGDELYHKQRAGVFMGGGIVAQRETGQGSRLEMHRRGGVGHYAARCLALYFRECRLPRFGRSAVRSGRDDRFGGRLAQDFAGLGATIEQRLERTAAASHATPGMERPPSTGTCSPTTDNRSEAATNCITASPSRGPRSLHAYASACIVEYGRRYTLALTWV